MVRVKAECWNRESNHLDVVEQTYPNGVGIDTETVGGEAILNVYSKDGQLIGCHNTWMFAVVEA